MMKNGETMYFNLICEEICVTGGKVIHIDENRGRIEDIHKIVDENFQKYPNAKWEMYVKGIVAL